MPEGAGTVLDNSCLMFLSNMWIGRKHDNSRLPLVLAGGLGGLLETGRRRRQSENVQLVSLHHGSHGSQTLEVRSRRNTLAGFVRTLRRQGRFLTCRRL